MRIYKYSKYKVAINRLISERIVFGSSQKTQNFGYKLVIDNSNYSIYERPFLTRNIVAACENVIVTRNIDTKSNTLYIYPNYLSKLVHYKIKFTSKNYPCLIEGSNILQCILIPYMRRVNLNSYVKSIRLVVITDKCQVYHNFPARRKDCDGLSEPADIHQFEGSAIWDLPEHKYPSQFKAVDSTEYEFPFLPAQAYEYHPMLNTDKNFKDRYGNGGFGNSTDVVKDGMKRMASRFYFPNRNDFQSNSFHHIGGAAIDYKLTLLGTYRSNTSTGVRTVVFATDDGGRNWFCKYEFADSGEYEFKQGKNEWGHNFGNPINTTAINKTYKPFSMSLKKRNIIYPSSQNKEPSQLFTWGEPIKISDISHSQIAEITTEIPHGLKTGNIIALTSEDIEGGVWNLLTNNTIDCVSGGNGILYKVEAIDKYHFKLYECVSSAFNNITCRHIHHINRIKDGYLMGTGEIYPNGWLFYIQRKEADTFTEIRASDELIFIRLNSCENSVQRTLGAIMLDDNDSTIIYASDHDMLIRKDIKMPENRSIAFSRNSTGIFMGKLCDIDDLNKFEILFEVEEPSFFFKKIEETLIFCGQRGELAMSFDMGKTWKKSRIHNNLMKYNGKTSKYMVFDNCILLVK